jgi:hypothetical protein
MGYCSTSESMPLERKKDKTQQEKGREASIDLLHQDVALPIMDGFRFEKKLTSSKTGSSTLRYVVDRTWMAYC